MNNQAADTWGSRPDFPILLDLKGFNLMFIILAWSNVFLTIIKINSGNIQREPIVLNFEKDTEIYLSCGATLNGRNWIIGGLHQKRQVSFFQIKQKLNARVQISRIDECKIKKVGTLDFDFYNGACSTYQFDVEKILFCFGDSNNYNHPGYQRECHL